MDIDELNIDNKDLNTVSKGADLVIRSSGKITHVVGSDLLEHVEIRPDLIERECFTLYDIVLARRLKAVPVKIEFEQVTIALSDPSDLSAMDDLRYKLTPREVIFVAAEPEMVDLAISRWSRTVARTAETEVIKEFQIESEANAKVKEVDEETGRMSTLINQVLIQAVSLNASDIHIEPTETQVVVRFRVDGVLIPHHNFPLSVANGIVNFFKVKGDMEVADRRRPQDGRFGLTVSGREVDFRVVTLPTAHGPEGIVIRLFDQSRARLNLDEVGFHSHLTIPLTEILESPHGMILVTGPTGSGKTTTLYASLGLIARPDRKVLTVEDPVEIRFQGITQVQVNEEAQLTFATALKSFLRADPDIMLVGEIRDTETANLAAQAALTGHLVLSTLHTNEAAGAATRLINLGLEPFIIASALKAVLAQRLMRKLCRSCALPFEPTEEELKKVKWPENIEVPDQLWKSSSAGCATCDGAGYKGRLVVGELIIISDKFAAGIVDMVSSSDLEKIAFEDGTIGLHHDAILWAASGATSLEEIKRAGV
jgi:type IV pilus assembly protein PilB